MATLRAHLPTTYPSVAVPLVVVEGQHITPAIVGWAVARLEELFVPGEPVLYAWVEAFREEVALDTEAKEAPRAAAAAATSEQDQAAERHDEVSPRYSWRSAQRELFVTHCAAIYVAPG